LIVLSLPLFTHLLLHRHGRYLRLGLHPLQLLLQDPTGRGAHLHALQKRTPLVLDNFSYVCPEPVLANTRFLVVVGHKMAQPKRASLLLLLFLGGGPHRFRQPLLVLALALHKLLLEAHLHTPGLRLRLRGLQRLQLVLEQPTLPCFIVEDRVS
jgi:hypothetical protein